MRVRADGPIELRTRIDPRSGVVTTLPAGGLAHLIEKKRTAEGVWRRLVDAQGRRGWAPPSAPLHDVADNDMRLSSRAVELREAPASSAPVLRTLRRGASFALVEVAELAGETWVRVEMGAKGGWIPGETRVARGNSLHIGFVASCVAFSCGVTMLVLELVLARFVVGGVVAIATGAIAAIGAASLWDTWPFRASSVARRYARSNGGGA